jgi:hypothetical protein
MKRLVLAAVLLSAGSAHADAPAERPVCEQFAEAVSAIVKDKVDPAATRDGIPMPIVRLVELHHLHDGAAKNVQRNTQAHLERFKTAAQKFDASLTAYKARRDEVSTAVEKAKSQPPAEAMKTLLSVITPNQVDAEGRIDVHRAFLEPRDAEIDAILAYGKLAATAKDYAAVGNLSAMLYAHRRVSSDECAERLLWFARENRKDLEGLGGGTATDAIADVVRRADGEVRTLQSLGRGMRKAILSLGVHDVLLYDSKSAKKGDLIVFQIEPKSIAAKAATVSEHNTFQVPYNCVETNKVAAFNPYDGRIIWEQKCDFRDERVNLDVKISLAAPAPGWAKAGDRLWFLGRVEKAGPKWVIKDAAVLDWRFVGFAPDDYQVLQR